MKQENVPAMAERPIGPIEILTPNAYLQAGDHLLLRGRIVKPGEVDLDIPAGEQLIERPEDVTTLVAGALAGVFARRKR